MAKQAKKPGIGRRLFLRGAGTAVLGLPFLFGAPSLAFFHCGEVRLMLTLPSSAELDHPASPIYFRVDQIEAKLDAMQAAGAHIERAAQRACSGPAAPSRVRRFGR